MKKIHTLYVRDQSVARIAKRLGKPLTEEVDEDCVWVVAGEGVATRKWDGTPVMWDGTKWYCRAGTDWRELTSAPSDKWILEAVAGGEAELGTPMQTGSYEALGPMINGNPDKLPGHTLRKHGDVVYEDVPTHLEDIKAWLTGKDIEGIVWHHPDGRMAKIKLKDFGLKRGES